MTKLNLSALKKQAGNPSPKVPEEIITSSMPAWVNISVEATDEVMAVGSPIPPTLTTASATAGKALPSISSEPPAPVTGREFFPNLTVSTKYEMDEILTTTSETQSIIMSEWLVDAVKPANIVPSVEVISETELVIKDEISVSPFPEAEHQNEIVSQESFQDLSSEDAPSKVSLTEVSNNPVYVQSVAEDLSKVREWGLKRLSSGKKVALVSFSGMIICAAVVAWLYSFGVFPAFKASVIEAPLIVAVTPPAVVLVNTGVTNTWSANTEATLPITSSGITALSSTGNTMSASGSLTSSTGSSITSTGVVLSNTSTGTLLTTTETGEKVWTGSIASATGSTTSGSGTKSSTWSTLTPIKPPQANTLTGTTASTVRTPNIRVPRTK